MTMACSVCGTATKNKTCGARCNSIAQTRKVRARRKLARTPTKKLYRHTGTSSSMTAREMTEDAEVRRRVAQKVPAKPKKIRQATDRILLAIKGQGFGDFRSYLAARTVKADGKGTWTLVDMARDLGVPISGFISYHARWVDEQQTQARKMNGGANG
jgi:hypothetical protein